VSIEIQHPRRCDPAQCTVTSAGEHGSHRSVPMVMTADETSDTTVQVWLHQSTRIEGDPGPGATMVVLDLHIRSYDRGGADVEVVWCSPSSARSGWPRCWVGPGRRRPDEARHPAAR
jgi:hypothetical protein